MPVSTNHATYGQHLGSEQYTAGGSGTTVALNQSIVLWSRPTWGNRLLLASVTVFSMDGTFPSEPVVEWIVTGSPNQRMTSYYSKEWCESNLAIAGMPKLAKTWLFYLTAPTVGITANYIGTLTATVDSLKDYWTFNATTWYYARQAAPINYDIEEIYIPTGTVREFNVTMSKAARRSMSIYSQAYIDFMSISFGPPVSAPAWVAGALTDCTLIGTLAGSWSAFTDGYWFLHTSYGAYGTFTNERMNALFSNSRNVACVVGLNTVEVMGEGYIPEGDEIEVDCGQTGQAESSFSATNDINQIPIADADAIDCGELSIPASTFTYSDDLLDPPSSTAPGSVVLIGD